jgi:hypothetical protein
MAFSIKQLLFSMAVAAFGLVAMLSEYRTVLGKVFDGLTLVILVAIAYGAWLFTGERRAFRVGFLCWAVLYFLLFKQTFDVGISDLANLVRRAVQAQSFVASQSAAIDGGGFTGSFWPIPHSNFYPAFHTLLLLLLGLIGGCVTVYFYRKRERKLAK